MAITKDEVVEFIANMSVLDLSEFIKELEEKFGVSAAAPVAAIVAAPAADAATAKQPRLRTRRPLAAPRPTGPAPAAGTTPGRGSAALRRSTVAGQGTL